MFRNVNPERAEEGVKVTENSVTIESADKQILKLYLKLEKRKLGYYCCKMFVHVFNNCVIFSLHNIALIISNLNSCNPTCAFTFVVHFHSFFMNIIVFNFMFCS